MTQELIDLKTCLIEGRYAEALEIVEELESMSKQAILARIQSYLAILIIHLIKNQVEQRLTNSWASSIRNAIREIKKYNLKDNKTSFYINGEEWQHLLEEEIIESAIADASDEVLNGKYSRAHLASMLDKTTIIQTAVKFLHLTYNYSAKELPAIMDEYLSQLPGGDIWLNRGN
ncbi:MAG TPA: DUF29 family protein [Oscillatoriaceae cyanobacterium M33_DOE_052]|uniref:DUF29 family protein n=1 Tax=Planktothricoides sp. SpSt-374 TaxID=2282167 RepID=A0A7C3ZQJ9_9CYAN|nr:DUF29 family protein [Oscillatoriaceae cyanobacterium M33_DOE_052]